MKHILLATLFLFFSCDFGPDEHNSYDNFYKSSIRNSSSVLITITTYDSSNNTNNNLEILPNNIGLECVYTSETFRGYNGVCDIDSIKIAFPNGKGYLCSIGEDESLCFGNEVTPWSLNEKFINTNGNTYEFTITEQDYENAHELPN